MTSSRRRALSLALCLAAVAAGTPAAAQTSAPTAGELETARSLYKQGKELRAHGDLRGALEKLQAAHALGNTPVTGIELARTYVLVGQIVEAREVCLWIGRMPVAPDETEKSAEARSEATKLADDLGPRIPTLAVKVLGLAPGESPHLSIDGIPVPDAAMSEPQKVNPGKHAVLVRAGEGRQALGTAEVAEGTPTEITLTLPVRPPAPGPAPASAPALAPASAPASEPRSSPLVKIGVPVAAVGGVFGAVAGLVALNKRGQLDTLCQQGLCDAAHGGASDLAQAYTWANVSTISFVVAGAGVVTIVAGLISGGSRAPGDAARLAPWIGPGAAGIHGLF